MLRHLGWIAVVGLAASGAHAAKPTIVDACLRAVAIEMKAETISGEDVQSFPELSPPRTQMVAVYAVSVEPDAVAKTLGAKPELHTRKVPVRCSFMEATAPFELSSLTCPDFECSISPERLEELQDILRREGF